MYIFAELVDSHSSDKIDNFEICLKTLHDLNASTPVSEENLTIVLETIEASSSGFQARMRDSVLKLRGNPIFCMMNIKKEDVDSAFRKVSEPSESLNVRTSHYLHALEYSCISLFAGSSTSAAYNFECQVKKCILQNQRACRFAIIIIFCNESVIC